MKDLLLWRALGAREPLPEELVPLLEELVATSTVTMPFVGRLIRAARDERPRVRAAALAGLAGAAGPEALRAVVNGLDDPVPAVAAVAVESLRSVGRFEPYRIVHAMFHANPQVRQAALAGELPKAVGPLVPHLLADEACAESILPRLAGVDELPGFALPAILDGVATGRFSVGQAGDLVGRIPPAAVAERIATAALADAAKATSRSGPWPPQRVGELLETLGREPVRPVTPFTPTSDRLPEVIRLLGDVRIERPHRGPSGDAPIDALVRSLHDVAEPRVRYGVALAAAARLLDGSPDEATLVRLLVAAWPAATLWKWLDVQQRRTAVDDFLSIPADRLDPLRFGIAADEWLTAVDESDLLRDAPGATIDMRTLAGVARLTGLDALQRTTGHFRVEDLALGLLHPSAGPFLSVPGSAERRFQLVARVRGNDRSLWPRRLAHLVTSFNRELLPLVSDFTPAATHEMLAVLQRFDPPIDVKDHRGRRLQGVSTELGRLLAGVPRPHAAGGVRTISSGPRLGEFVFEAGPHVMTPAPAKSPEPERFGAELAAFARQWREGPRVPAIDAFLRAVFLAAVESLPEAVATRRLAEVDSVTLRFLLLEQFADESILARLEGKLRAALAEGERPAPASLFATLTAAGGIVGGLNRMWAALVGDAVPKAGSPPAATTAVAAPPESQLRPLRLALVDLCRLIDAKDSEILRLIRPWANQPTQGLAACLARRKLPQPRGADAAAAILMCHDPLPTVDQALAAFLPAWPSVICARLDADLVARRPGDERLTLALHAWLWRWDRHLDQGLALLADSGQPLSAVVVAARSLTCLPLAIRLLEFVGAALERAGFRDMTEFRGHATDALADETLAALTSPAGAAAAAVLVAWSRRDPGSSILAKAWLRVLALLPDIPRPVRDVLEPWASSRGLEDREPVAARPTLRDEFDACLSRGTPVTPLDADQAIASVIAEEGPAWFTPADWDRLVVAGVDARVLAHRLAIARQPHAYAMAVETLLTEARPDADDLAAVAAFLEQGDTRLAELRTLAARLLHAHGNPAGFPLLFADETDDTPCVPRLFVGLDAATVADAVRSALAARSVEESVLADLLLEPAIAADARAAGLRILLVEGASDTVRDRILPHLSRSRTGSDRLQRVAESFAWGVHRGLELTGKLFTVEMIAGEGLGFTRLKEPRVFVNPLPILRGERYGEEIVRGLVVHEVGHHVYHADADTLEAADTAREEGIFSLLNLVMDEQLERNLRSLDPAMGDPLKRLAAYAFQHTPREISVPKLLGMLDDRAFAVLTQVRLAVARRADHVVVHAGRVLRLLEQHGNSFSRFVRGLRMGLGRRLGDARAAEALSLFGPGFRHSTGPRLLEIARELRRIFGAETRLLDLLGNLGTPVTGTPGDATRAGEGITDREVQREVERVLAPPSQAGGGPAGRPKGRGHGRLVINVSSEEDFARISSVAQVPFDPAKSAAYRRRVARPAAELRRFFAQLGSAHEQHRQRLQGRLLDRSRLLALAVRGEPRVMMSRRLVPSPDLFLGVAVDCSGSMSDGDNIEKARLFAELLAESVRGCRGVDFHVYGFNDSTLFDAGSAERCAAHALEEGGGNNDAAGLWHLATRAFASQRRAKLLVMISDGLPTECSTAALRKLVEVLSQRYHMCCAQVAVRPLEKVCFPIHVLLDDQNLGGAVAAFGRTVMRLVSRAVAGGG